MTFDVNSRKLGIAALTTMLVLVLLSLWFGSSGAQSWTLEKIELAKKYERMYCLPHGICRAFNLQENSGKVDAAAIPRVEYPYFNQGGRHYMDGVRSAHAFLSANPDIARIVPFDIERVQEAMSWGEWQLMGFNYRALGCTEPYFANLNFEQRLKYWAKFFAGYMRRYKTLARAVKMYNGPSAKASYAANVLKYCKRFSY